MTALWQPLSRLALDCAAVLGAVTLSVAACAAAQALAWWIAGVVVEMHRTRGLEAPRGGR